MSGSDDIRKGAIIELDGKLLQIIEYQHIKMKRTALLRIKLRDIRDGHNIERTFQSGEKFNRVRLDTRQMQYLYNDGDLYYFMDEETFEQLPINEGQLGEAANYLKEGMSIEVSSYNNEVISIELPITVELKVTKTEPGFKGDTATAGNKPAILETGKTIQVPLFINEEDIIKVDTRNGQYLERIS